MLNTLITTGAIPDPVANFHVSSNPDPPYPALGGFTVFTATFDANLLSHTYVRGFINGVEFATAYAAPGAISLLVSNVQFGAPGTVTFTAIHVNSPSATAWPRSSITTAPESYVVT